MVARRTSSLEFVWTDRGGQSGSTERRYQDLTIDGVALSRLFDGDWIAPFGWSSEEEHVLAIQRLLREAPPDLPGDRVSLYVCPECGDLGCGAIGVVVEHTAAGVVWRDFAFQYTDGDGAHQSPCAGVGPFLFDTDAYREFFASLLRNAALASRASNTAVDNSSESS